MNTNPYLNAFYQSYDEDSRLAPRHGSVEFLTTMRYIAQYRGLSQPYAGAGKCIHPAGKCTGPVGVPFRLV